MSGTGKSFTSNILLKQFEGFTVLNLGKFREQLGITSYSRKDTPKLLAMAIDKIEQNHHKSTVDA